LLAELPEIRRKLVGVTVPYVPKLLQGDMMGTVSHPVVDEPAQVGGGLLGRFPPLHSLDPFFEIIDIIAYDDPAHVPDTVATFVDAERNKLHEWSLENRVLRGKQVAGHRGLFGPEREAGRITFSRVMESKGMAPLTRVPLFGRKGHALSHISEKPYRQSAG
jgi:hypothetical protein